MPRSRLHPPALPRREGDSVQLLSALASRRAATGGHRAAPSSLGENRAHEDPRPGPSRGAVLSSGGERSGASC